MKANAVGLCLLILIPVFFGCCCSAVTPEEGIEAMPPEVGVEEGEYPAPGARGPEVSSAGWRTPLAAAEPAPGYRSPAGGGDLEEFRQSNLRLRQQVENLTREVESLHGEREAAAAPAVGPGPAPDAMGVAPAAPPASSGLTVETVRAVLASSGAGEFQVTLNPRNEVYLTLAGTVSFASGKATLKSSAQELLTRALSALKSRFPGMRVRVEGHTDSDPIRKSNWASNEALSKARAQAVADHVVRTTPLTPAEVGSSGFGAGRPIASNATRDGKAQNRRCEIVLLP